MGALEIDYLNAISRGHYQDVIHFIESGININTKDNNGETGIFKAMKNGYHEIVKYLLQNGVNLKDNKKELIFEAAKKGYLDIVISLLKYEESSEVRKKALNIAQKVLNQKELLQGIQEQNVTKVIKAIENGADINNVDILSWSPLMNSILKGNKQITEILIKNNANINYKNNNDETALSKAVEKGDIFIVELLLKNGANPDIRDKFNNTPLIYATKHGDLDIIRLLVKYGVNINAKNNDKETPLLISIKNNFIDIAEYLIKKGAKKVNSLYYSYDYKHFYLTEILLSYEENKEKKKYFRNLLNLLDTKTRLEIEIKKDNLDGIKDILRTNTCKDLNELLFMATKLSKNKIVNYLILLGANPNSYINNLSPLMIATSRGDLEMVKTLILCNVDVNGKGNFILGFPLTIAINEGYFNIVKLLVENGADIYKSYGFKSSALEEAKTSSNINIVNYLKDIG